MPPLFCIRANILIETAKGVQIAILGGCIATKGGAFLPGGGCISLGGVHFDKAYSFITFRVHKQPLHTALQLVDFFLGTQANTPATLFS